LVTYRITLDPACANLYQKVAQRVGLPTEQVLSDALYKLAGSLSLEAMAKKAENTPKG